MCTKRTFIRLAGIVSLLFGVLLTLEASYTCDELVKYPSPIVNEFKNIMGTNAFSILPCYGISPRHLHASDYLYFSNSSLQGSKVSKNNNTSVWKQAGIYGLEFVAAGVGGTLSYSLAFVNVLFKEHYPYGNSRYAMEFIGINLIGNILLGAPLTWVVGKMIGQKGSLGNAMIGTSISGIIGSKVGIIGLEKDDIWLACIFPPIISALGSVIGYNW